VPAAATAMIPAKTLTAPRRVRCVRSRLLSLNQFATLMPPYRTGKAGVPLFGHVPTRREMRLVDRFITPERFYLSDPA